MTLKKLLFFVTILLLLVAGCTSKSGELAKIPLEKCVVLQAKYSHYDSRATMTYKVKRIDKGTISVFTLDTSPRNINYAVGDTILRRFIEY